jgi:hypothetical protein
MDMDHCLRGVWLTVVERDLRSRQLAFVVSLYTEFPLILVLKFVAVFTVISYSGFKAMLTL